MPLLQDLTLLSRRDVEYKMAWRMACSIPATVLTLMHACLGLRILHCYPMRRLRLIAQALNVSFKSRNFGQTHLPGILPKAHANFR